MLGFWCSHAYPYNNNEESPLPATLKGVDAAVWECFKALGVDVYIAPLVKMDDSLLYEDSSDEATQYSSHWIVGKKFGVHQDNSYQVDDASDYQKMYAKWGRSTNGPIYWLTDPKHSELQIIYTAASSNYVN